MCLAQELNTVTKLRLQPALYSCTLDTDSNHNMAVICASILDTEGYILYHEVSLKSGQYSSC